MILLIALSLPTAIACQYGNDVYITEKHLNFYVDSKLSDKPLLYIKDLQQGNSTTNTKAQFKLYNNYSGAIVTDVYFFLNGDQYEEKHVTIDSGGYALIQKEVTDTIVVDKMAYDIKNIGLSAEWENVPVFLRRDCQKCAGQDCWDDGYQCNPLYDDTKCGSGICNIAGFCDHEKIVNCTNGQRNCDNRTCLTQYSKTSGQSYLCEWECSTDTKACNNMCMTPNSKKTGEPYLCDWECKETLIGKNGICSKTNETIIKERTYWIIGIALLLILIWIWIIKGILLKTKKRIEKQIQDLEEKEWQTKENLNKLTEHSQKLRNDLDEKKELLASKEKEVTHIKDNLDKIQQKIINAKQEAENRFKTEYSIYTEDLHKLRKKIALNKGEQRKKFEKEKDKKEAQLAKIDDKIKHAEKEATKAFAEAYRKEEERLHTESKKLDEINAEISKKKTAIKSQNQEIEEELRKDAEFVERKKQLLKEKDDLAIREMAREWNLQEHNLFINDKGYIQFKFSKNGSQPGLELHRYIYEKKFGKIAKNREIHHIDGNKLNDYLWNLIDLPEDKHDSIDNMKIKNESWENGLKYLLHHNLVKESELHNAIREKAKNLL